MPILTPVEIVLCGAILAAVAIHFLKNGHIVTIGVMLAGWVFLPNGEYPREVIEAFEERGGPVHALALPHGPWLNKSSALSLGCLAGVCLFRRSPRFRSPLRIADLAMIAWILSPAVAAIFNGRPIHHGAANVCALALGWGVPYLLGIICLHDEKGMLQFLRTCVVLGVACLPLATAEFFAGPFWYDALYGSHPYRFDGSDRPFGHRPLLFFEHGNQAGMWFATAAIAATGLVFISDTKPARGRNPNVLCAILLMTATILWQSHGAIVLMLAAFLIIWMMTWRPSMRNRTIFFTAVVVAGACLLVVLALTLRFAATREQMRSWFHGIGKSSFTWRLARIEEHLGQLTVRPLFGYGTVDWSHKTPDNAFFDPIALNFTFLVCGAFGLLAALAVAWVLVVPAASFLIKRLRDKAPVRLDAPALLAVVVAVNACDLLFNSGLILPYLMAVGGLTHRTSQKPNSLHDGLFPDDT